MGAPARAGGLLALIAGLTACAQRTPESGAGDGARSPGADARPQVTGNQQQDDATLRLLRSDAHALADSTGCSDAAHCRAAPLGAKPCGGPWEYVVYCSISTDSAALFRQLELVRQFEDSLNRLYQRVSTCDLLLEPRVTLEGSACRAASPAP